MKEFSGDAEINCETRLRSGMKMARSMALRLRQTDQMKTIGSKINDRLKRLVDALDDDPDSLKNNRSKTMLAKPNKFIWFFRLANGGNMCHPYNTECDETAILYIEKEYGVKVTAAVRRELTNDEYLALLRCNMEGYYSQTYAAIQDFFFRCDPRAGDEKRKL